MELALAAAAENDGSRSICTTNDGDANAAECLWFMEVGYFTFSVRRYAFASSLIR